MPVESLARRLAASRSMITMAWSLQRGDHGEQPYWMAAVLAAMLGQIGLPGGGVGYGYAAEAFVGSPIKRLGGLALDQGKNAAGTFIPVARITDMLLDPGGSFDFDGQRLQYPDTRLVYWCGGNPFHHHQDLNRLNEAWQRPDTVIVNEPWWTPAARRADIMFPATTSLERNDVGRASSDDYVFPMHQAIEPVGEARSDFEIFSGLADKRWDSDRSSPRVAMRPGGSDISTRRSNSRPQLRVSASLSLVSSGNRAVSACRWMTPIVSCSRTFATTLSRIHWAHLRD